MYVRGMGFYFKFSVIKEIGKDVNSKCDIKYDLANVSIINIKWEIN